MTNRTLSRHTPYEDLPERLRVDEYSQLTDTSPATVYEAVRRGDLPAIRIGRRVLIPRTALQATCTEQG